MKTFSTEKNNIPEGATHTYDHGGSKCGYYKLVDGNWFYWGWCKAWYAVIDNQLFYDAKPIPQTKVVEWVNGLPPIGERVVFCFADYELPMWLEIGDEVEIICHDVNNGMPVAVFKKKAIHGIEIDFGGSKSFSKLETEAERVEREREEFKIEMCKDLGIDAVGCNTACIINKLYELGYRKESE